MFEIIIKSFRILRLNPLIARFIDKNSRQFPIEDTKKFQSFVNDSLNFVSLRSRLRNTYFSFHWKIPWKIWKILGLETGYSGRGRK